MVLLRENKGTIMMDDIKVVTICGSMKFKNEMLKVAQDLELKNGYSVLQCVYYDDNNWENYDIDKETFGKLHLKRIEISDAIFVVNVNGYIGESTKNEIAYAKSLHKEILSLEPLNLN